MLSGRGLCDELITRPEESYRLCCVVVCDLETSRMGAPYIYDISRLRVNVLSYPVGGQKTVDAMVEGYFMLKYMPGNSNVHCIYKISFIVCTTSFPFPFAAAFSSQVFRIHKTDEQLFLVSVPKPLFCVHCT